MNPLRFNLVKLSLVAIVIAVISGIVFFSTIEPKACKYLMPASYRLYLKKGIYTVWYYPDWKKVGQEQFTIMEDTKIIHRLKIQIPKVAVKSPNDLTVDYKKYDDSHGLYGGGSMIYKLRIGRFEIKKTGIYKVYSSLDDKKTNFVLAIVPASLHDPSIKGYHGPGGPIFAGSEERSVIQPAH